MLVKFTDTLTITEMYNLARFNEIKLVQGARPYTYTQKNAPSAASYDAHIKELGARRITYDDGLSLQNKLICNLDGFGNLDGNGTCVSGGFNTDNSPRMGDTVVDLMGVLYYKWAGSASSDATWRVTSIKDGTVNFVKTNPRPQIPPSVGGALTLVSANVLNFFLTLDDGSSTTQNGLEPRGANNQEEFDRQAKKLVNSIIALDPDVLGMLELENYFSQGSAFNALEFLVAELNKVAGAGYFAWVIPGQSYVDISDAISSGFLFKTSSIEWLGNVAVLRDEVLSSIGIDNSTAVFDGPNTNRASIAASFKPKGGACITVALNHLKSKGGSGTGDDADQIDGSGNWNAIRLKVRQNMYL
jgi:predicted extracellular nuclease